MIRRPPRSTRTDTLLPYTTFFRSRGLARFVPCAIVAAGEGAQGAGGRLPVGGGDQHQLARVAPGGVVGMMRADARAAGEHEDANCETDEKRHVHDSSANLVEIGKGAGRERVW